MNMDEAIIFSTQYCRGFGCSHKTLLRVRFKQHSQKRVHGDDFEGSRIYFLEMLKQLQILFLFNVSLLTDKYVDCFFPGIKLMKKKKNPLTLVGDCAAVHLD